MVASCYAMSSKRQLLAMSAAQASEGALTAAAHLAHPPNQSKEQALHTSQLSSERFAASLHAAGMLGESEPSAWLEDVFLPRLMGLTSLALQSVFILPHAYLA